MRRIKTPEAPSLAAEEGRGANGHSPRGARTWRAFGHDAYAWLQTPVHASTLGFFRIAFSICMYRQALLFRNMFNEFRQARMVFPYPALGWIEPVQYDTGNLLLYINRMSCVFVGVGLMTKPMTCVLFATFTYLFVLCEANHNNHYILICHVTGVASLIDWGRYLSVDWLLSLVAHRSRVSRLLLNPSPSPTVPYWHLFSMQIMFSIPYFYGSIAKANPDWLFRAQPLKNWFGTEEDQFDPHNPHTKYFGWVAADWWFPWFIAWGGFAFDFGIVWLLMSRHIRFWIAFPSAVMFNVMNKLMFNIGIFPYAMLGSMSLFAEPCFFARLGRTLRAAAVGRSVSLSAPLADYSEPRWHWWWFVPAWTRSVHRGAGGTWPELDEGGRSLPSPKPASLHLTWRQIALLSLFAFYFGLFHLLWPLRHFVIYEYGVSWHEEGHLHSWHMKLRSKRGWVMLLATEENGRRMLYDPISDPMITYSQKKKVASRPHALILYANTIARTYMEAGRNISSLRAYSCFSLNSRSPAPLYGPPETDLLDIIGQYELLPPLHPSAVGTWLTRMPPADKEPGQHYCRLRYKAEDYPEIADVKVAQREDFDRLSAEAGVRWAGRGMLKHVSGDYAYLHGWHRMNDKLAAYLARRRDAAWRVRAA